MESGHLWSRGLTTQHKVTLQCGPADTSSDGEVRGDASYYNYINYVQVDVRRWKTAGGLSIFLLRREIRY